ncbi:hypothetical protein PV10_08601 [Exophiala mesophila]|uniref:Cupin type-2 domain-containing protein n=1 Tax=Exophiala mesophila TaxID=212818 RepID=A0A0D1Z2I8_EXOME|nr:uncharacterized protein PV10_08601 [Exophiala mesophila]KIV88977.1 hypothetical protein PV10_08601 [Exophiala mesophila]
MVHDITTRRVVTGHDADGKAIFVDDTVLTSLDPRNGQPQSGGFYGNSTIWKTVGIPSTVNAPFTNLHGKPIGITEPDGVICRVINFPPQGPVKDEFNIMHRTQSEDFGIVIEGEMELVLEGGNKTTLKKGDVVVQRGTNHQWINTSPNYCVMAFILVPSDKPVIEKTGEVLESTVFPSS